MLSANLIGYLSADAKETEKGYSFSVAHNYHRKGDKETLWVNCYVNFKTGVGPYLKAGTPVYLQGDLNVSLYTPGEGRSPVIQCKMDVCRIQLLPSAKRSEQDSSDQEPF